VKLRPDLLSTDWPSGYDRIILDQVDSTMNEALRRKSFISKPTWILAKHQMSAYGRRGRPWISPVGNFSATLAININEEANFSALRSFTASLALYDALVAVTKQSNLFSLKWPNDVLMDSKKVAGILLQSSGKNGKLDFLMIGIGVNFVKFSNQVTKLDSGHIPVISLFDFGYQISEEEFLVYLANSFDFWEQKLLDSGFSPVREVWLDRASRLGQKIVAKTISSEYHGIFETIDNDGALVLLTNEGHKKIRAADVYFFED
jgi:BirA family biotin operon repressor/biotin-[acetyl-CoA-carboxylase] ligase